MTLDPLRDLQAAILNWLTGQASLSVWLGTPARIYDQPPAEPVYPYVTLGRVQAQAIGGVDCDLTEQTLSLLCVSRFGGSEEARAMAGELRVLLDGAALTLTDQALVSLRVSFIDVLRAADRRTTYALVRLRAVSEPL
ncbi:DUF3168 domain-containing protein [Asticcacaulis sp. EMRT-3]|uniref:DUF3168 domain-containing protein n=1 Tax=Asticcacaulis sp. EMRT-3 TaxID=3040349 RepID=UPI0024AF69B4|nr:DUF3168 domain-containing protein [Asticcacaulis sp. EMRT-3]MDI7775383.1 DUF3168 domain-containing protein [Asticcacaulis sp. EMRT-3]